MVLDTSAVVAILLQESTRAALLAEIVSHTTVIAAPSALEVHMVMRKYLGNSTENEIAATFLKWGVSVVEFTPDQAVVTARAFDTYGKGRHPAGLNFGECIAYAVAKVTHQTLLYVGDDFSLTDIRPALVI